PAYVSTLTRLAATRLSNTSDDLAFVVIQESFITEPVPGLGASAVDWAVETAGASARASTVRPQSASLMGVTPLFLLLLRGNREHGRCQRSEERRVGKGG